jgi:glycerophosphoryl diester phosphodiesterase
MFDVMNTRRPIAIFKIAMAIAVLTLMTPSSAMSAPDDDAVATPPSCPVTAPNGEQPPAGEHVFGRGPGGHGNDALWTNLWTWGVGAIRVPPDHVNADGSLGGMKWPWWRGVPGRLTIEGRRLDAAAPPLRADIPDGYGDRGFQVSGLIFPTTGCWEVTGRVGEASLTFVVEVEREDLSGGSFAVVAHRGVHQTFPLTGLTNETCTATIIDLPTHDYIENTIPSMQAAFAAGATAVELDVHRTADGQLIVFHDWTLDCRTNGTGVTNEQPLAYLQSLDVGYGYTADGGKSFPLRGKGIGMMPTLPEVLAAFPDQHFIINEKDGDRETLDLLIASLSTLPSERRALLSYWGDDFMTLHQRLPELQPYFYGERELRACLGDYLEMLVTGTLPPRCREHIIAIPVSRLNEVPGGLERFLSQAHQAGARVYVTDLDTPEQFASVGSLPLDGIQTNHSEIIGPLIRETK